MESDPDGCPRTEPPWMTFSSSGERSQGPPRVDQRVLRWRKGGTQDLKVDTSPGELERNESQQGGRADSIPDPD